MARVRVSLGCRRRDRRQAIEAMAQGRVDPPPGARVARGAWSRPELEDPATRSEVGRAFRRFSDLLEHATSQRRTTWASPPASKPCGNCRRTRIPRFAIDKAPAAVVVAGIRCGGAGWSQFLRSGEREENPPPRSSASVQSISWDIA
jgi:hypothetical protein